MADIKFLVTVDMASGQTSLKEFAGQVDKLGDTTKGTSEKAGLLHSSFIKLAASMTAALGVTHLASKAWSGFKDLLGDSIGAAAGAEKANVALDAALFTTGRTTAKLSEHFKIYADSLMDATILDDEAVKGAQALLLQLTKLDRDGIDRATKGTIGLARVFDMGLVPAAELVAKWMEGNTDRIAKYGIHIKDTMSLEEKQSAILEQLAVYYKRAESETGSYSGRLEQMKNVYKEVQEKLGTAVTQNETFQKTIKNIKDEFQFFIDSGQAEKWAANISKAVSGAVKAVETFFAIIKEGPFGGAKAWSEDMAGGMDKWNKVARENVKTITEFRDGLKWVKPSLADMRVEMEKGEKGWGEYRYRVATMDAEFEKNKRTLGGWMDKAFGLIGIQTEIAKSFDKSTKGSREFGDGLKKTVKILETPIWGKARKDIADMFADTQRASAVSFTYMGTTSKNTVLKIVNDFEWMKNWLKKDAEEVANKWKEKFDAIKQHTDIFLGGMSDVFNQYITNRSTAYENDYIRQKEAIEKSKMTEEEKNKAFEKLDADYAAKKRTAQRTEFIISKALRAGETLMASWQAATVALLVPPVPNFVLAAITKAFGVVQAALILAQPVPLQKGAYTLGEGLAYLHPHEIVAPRPMLKETIREAVLGDRGSSRVTHLHQHIYFGDQKIKEQIVEIVEEAGRVRGLKIMKFR